MQHPQVDRRRAVMKRPAKLRRARKRVNTRFGPMATAFKFFGQAAMWRIVLLLAVVQAVSALIRDSGVGAILKALAGILDRCGI